MIETTRFVQLLGQALATLALYDPGHPARDAAVTRTHEALLRALQSEGPLRLSLLGEKVVAGSAPLAGLPRWEAGERLVRAGVQRIEADPVPAPLREDVVALLAELRHRLDAPARLHVPWTRGSLRVGAIAVAMGEGEGGPARTVDALGRLAAYSLEEEAALVAHLHATAAAGGRVPIREAGAVAAALAAVVLAEQDVFPPLLQLRRFDEYTTTHSCNVAMLSIGLAERLGIASREVRAIGTAALVHDIGKVRLPPDMLARRGQLSDAEFAVVQRHPVEGARILARDGDDMLPATVAYEHHVHWHGRGGYPRFTFPRVTHYASRIVQVCDIYDAMCTDRPYRAALPPARALGIMRNASGSQVDPQVFAVFEAFVTRTLGVVPEEPPLAAGA